MSTLRYRVVAPKGIYVGENFYGINAIVSLTPGGAKYLLLTKKVALASVQAPVGEQPGPSEDEVFVDVRIGASIQTLSLTQLRAKFPNIVGPQGKEGAVGPRGLKGDKGDKGDAGQGIAVRGVVATAPNLPITGELGDVYISDDDSHGWVWTDEGWYDIGPFRGPPGIGIQGPQGDKGDKGDPGDPGNPTYASRAEAGAANAAASEEAAAGFAAEAAAHRDDAQGSASAAAGHAAAAETSKTNAATSETNAAGHAGAAAASASAASTDRSAAQGAASAAADYATTATTKAAEAVGAAAQASTSAETATNKATEAAQSESNAATSAGNALTSATTAQNALNGFKGIYYGAMAADPPLDPNGAAVTDGDFYFNTVAKKMRFYNGTAWADMVAGGTQKRFIYTATAGQTTFTGNDLFSNTLAYTPGCLEVVVNGIWIPYTEYTASNGTSVVLSSGATAGDVVYVFALAAFTVADTFQKSLNGSDILDKAAFRSNLGLTTNATAAVGQIPATTGTTQPSSGMRGERLTVSGSLNFAGSGVAGNVCFIDLAAGVWDLELFTVFGGPGGTTSSDWVSAISSVSGSVSSGLLGFTPHTRLPAGADMSIVHSAPRLRVTPATTTRYYLNAQAAWSGSSYSVTGSLQATRAS